MSEKLKDMNNVVLRPVRLSDVDFLWDILYYAIFIPENETLPSRDIVKTPEISLYMDNWGRHGDMGFIAEINGTPIGAIWCRLFNDTDHAFGYIDKSIPELGMAIIPGYRGQGLGSKMLEKLIDETKLLGYKGISLSVDIRNPANYLYRKFGFIEVGSSGNTICMKKEI